ncbi:disease resistance protein Pik-2-like [Triticum dicoccoides]|uniref:disease resistance protein Pik-2-like n=1 Tax=Triticum dicoccoides TaxID=85692 RepID=UPI00189104B4|nr:disease resistance protein Pik-2-like [Triticum dicoccoides]
MVETVLSMARSMLGVVVSLAASAAAAEMSLIMGVRKDIWFIKDELETMQVFLVVAERIKNKDMLLKVWAKQIRDLSYNIEDCLDEFMLHVGSQSLSWRLIKLKDRRRIAMQIRELKSRVEEVSNRNIRYNLIKTEASNILEIDSYTDDVRTHLANNIDEAELVGFSKPKEQLIQLMDVETKDGPAKVICLVGMGGLGKTTLARKTYESKEGIVKNFSCCAWITVSQSFLRIEILKDMIRQLLGCESLKKCLKEIEGKAAQVEDFARYLKKELKDKRYFLILDDLWTVEAWQWIKDIAIPNRNNKGSRIIVTTRDVGLAKLCTSMSLIYHLEPLQIDDATNLLLKKTGRTYDDLEKDDNLHITVEKLVRKCGCLPLAILTIGGILATKKVTEWGLFYSQLPTELETNPSLEAMRRIVTMSYNHLPSHLKSCFLYLSIFPEDVEIQMRHLVGRWIAEGFVRVRGGVIIEEVAKSYFDELINRSMIQPSKVNIEGCVKSCRVHDIMHDVMVSISREENFVCLAEDNLASVAGENFRHVAYHGSNIRCTRGTADGVIVPNGICNLQEIQTLMIVEVEPTACRAIKELGELTQLRKLGVMTHTASLQKCKILGASIEKLSSLSSLRVDGRGNSSTTSSLEWLHSISLSTPLLKSLKLVGSLGKEMPNWVGRLMYLVKIHLRESEMIEGGRSMKILGSLPNLMLLRLDWWSYSGEKLVLSAGAFPNLRKLDIIGLVLLREVRFVEGAAPHMERIEISWCKLESGIIGINHLPKLNEILLSYGAKVARFDTLPCEVNAHPNHPMGRRQWKMQWTTLQVMLLILKLDIL